MLYAVAGCKGCGNGGISQAEDTSYAVEAVRLLPYLQQHYSQHFIDQICLVKIDTEVTRTQLFATGGEYDKISVNVDIKGHDVTILEDMKNTTLRPPIMWIEWYFSFKFVDEKIKLLEVTI